jgi:hypothetical protein
MTRARPLFQALGRFALGLVALALLGELLTRFTRWLGVPFIVWIVLPMLAVVVAVFLVVLLVGRRH